jgi:hypothetical protein
MGVLVGRNLHYYEICANEVLIGFTMLYSDSSKRKLRLEKL